MDYRQKLNEVNALIGKDTAEQFPLSWPFVFDFAERLVLYRQGGRSLLATNAVRSDFMGTRNWLQKKYLARVAAYFALPKCSWKNQEHVAVSLTMIQRFPGLLQRLSQSANVIVPVTRASVPIAWAAKGLPYVGVDDATYTRRLEKAMGQVIAKIREAGERRETIAPHQLRPLLETLEKELNTRVEAYCRFLKKWKVTQYICVYGNRFDELLFCLACRRLGIPSKQVQRGTSPHKLETSNIDTPIIADYFYAWSSGYAESLKPFIENGGRSHIRVAGYPKYSPLEITTLQEKTPMRRLITYFSQPTYDIAETYSQVVTPQLIEEEKEYRRNLFTQLSQLAKAEGFELRVRYHQGEKSENSGCDRSAERDLLKSLGIPLSQNTFDQDFFETQMAVGINTSVLFEAKLAGKPSFQLRFKPTGNSYYPEVPLIDLSDLKEEIRKCDFELQKSAQSPSEKVANAEHKPLVDPQLFLSTEQLLSL